VNAVNLLPAKHRPRTPTGGQQGSSYAVIGVLGGLLLMVVLYVLTVNGINSSQEAVDRTKAETVQAKKRAEQLTPYGNFIQVKEQRVQSVKELATGRIDWERLARGLAHVLPADVWLISASASSTGQTSGGGSTPAASAPAAPSGSGGSGGSGAAASPPPASGGGEAKSPSMVLTGCAKSHPEVAVTLVRLRHLPGVSDVKLASIAKPDNAGAAGAPAPGAAPTAGGGGGATACGPINGKPAYKFEATVTFKPQPGSTPAEGGDKVPASLGGGQ
jgi:hypothetical protein